VDSARRIVPPIVIPLLAVVAIAGYLIGSHRASASSTRSSSTTITRSRQVVPGSSVLLEYPLGWRSITAIQTIPGLALAHSLLIAPGGDAAHAGLLAGELPAGAPSPLPASFLALVHGIPITEVLDLAKLQAYKYSGISGYDRTLDIYVILTAALSPTALVCYAANGYANYLQQCGQIVAKASLIGGQSAAELSPDAAYAAQLSALITALDGERVKLRREMHLQAAAVVTLAARLARRFAGAAASLAAIEPPSPASAAQAALASALTAARGAYEALAAAGTSRAADAQAQQRIQKAEAAVDSALENFALLGYNHT
jgi:hypothetical protein